MSRSRTPFGAILLLGAALFFIGRWFVPKPAESPPPAISQEPWIADVEGPLADASTTSATVVDLQTKILEFFAAGVGADRRRLRAVLTPDFQTMLPDLPPPGRQHLASTTLTDSRKSLSTDRLVEWFVATYGPLTLENSSVHVFRARVAKNGKEAFFSADLSLHMAEGSLIAIQKGRLHGFAVERDGRLVLHRLALVDSTFVAGEAPDFVDVTPWTGLRLAQPSTRSVSPHLAVSDVDQDGDMDLVAVGGAHVPTLFRNDGMGGFDGEAIEVLVKQGVFEGPVLTADFDADGDEDLVVGNVRETADGGGSITVYRKAGGQWRDGPRLAFRRLPYSGLAVSVLVACDLNADGLLDLYVGFSADRDTGRHVREESDAPPDRVFLNRGDLRFEAVGASASLPRLGPTVDAICFSDREGSGIELSSRTGPVRSLRLRDGVFALETGLAWTHGGIGILDGRPVFSGASQEGILDISGGSAALRYFRGSTVRGADLLNVGFEAALVSAQAPEPPTQVLVGGVDLSVAMGVDRIRGPSVVLDADGDGDQDIVSSDLRLFLNRSVSPRAVQVRLDGTTSAVQARLSSGTQVFRRGYSRAAGPAGQTAPELHFGLSGRAVSGTLVVQWPDGERQEHRAPAGLYAARRGHALKEIDGRRWALPARAGAPGPALDTPAERFDGLVVPLGHLDRATYLYFRKAGSAPVDALALWAHRQGLAVSVVQPRGTPPLKVGSTFVEGEELGRTFFDGPLVSPSVFLYDVDGRLVRAFVGRVPKGALRRAVDRITSVDDEIVRVLQVTSPQAGAGRIPEAEAALLDGLEKFGRDLRLRHQWGGLLAASGRHREASVAFAWVLRRQPEHHDALLGLAGSYRRLGRTSEAVRVLEGAVRAWPDSAELWCALGEIRLFVRDEAGAAIAFEAAVEVRPRFLKAWLGLVEARGRLGRPDVDEARRAADRLVGRPKSAELGASTSSR